MRCNRCNVKIFFEDQTQKCLRCGKEKYVPRQRSTGNLLAFKGNVQLVRQEGKEPLVVFSHVTEKGTTIQLRPRCPYCNEYMVKTSYTYLKERHQATNFKCTQDHQVILHYGEGKNIVGWH